MTPTIEILISPTGDIRLQTHGFVGPGCRAASALLEQALGQRTTEQVTAAFYQTSQQSTPLTQPS